MNCINSMFIEGYITKNPKLETLYNGTKVCSVNIAVSRTYKNSAGYFEEEVSYFDIMTYGNIAKICSTNCEKGRGVRVVGRLRQERWTDDGGRKHSKIVILAEHIEFKQFVKNTEENKV